MKRPNAAQPVSPHGAVAARRPGGDVALGVGLMLAFATFGPVIDVFAKLATDELPAAEITLGRFVTQTALLLPLVALRGGLRRMAPREAAIHAARSAVTSPPE